MSSGKNEQAPAPPAQSGGSGEEDMMGMMMMMQMMEGMNQQQNQWQPPPLPQMPDAPEVTRSQNIDWAEKQSQLSSKTKAQSALDAQRRKGRLGTIHTSPLLDEDPETTTSLLGKV